MNQTNTKTRSFLKLCLVTLFLCIVVVLVFSSQVRSIAKTSEPGLSRTPTQKNSAADVKLAEQVYKNIQIFKGMPASELEPTMAFISGSLGVKCNFCHVNPFDKDDRPTKQTARRMIRMVLDLNKGNFNGGKAVTCFTCHRGSPQPLSVPAVGQNLWQPGAASEKENPLPSANQILDKYVLAIGGEQAFHKLTSRVAKGSRIGADGVLVPEDVYQKAPNKILTIVTYPKVVFSTGFNGIAGWGNSSQDGVRDLPPPVLAQLKTDAEFYKEIKMKVLYRKLNVVGKSTVADNEVYVVEATPKDAPPAGRPEKLYFDVRTGLLVRRYLESETIMGMFPLQTDYSDYRDVDGIKQPFLIRWSMPGRSWGRQIAEMKQNVTLDDAQFNAPVAKP
jgi:photosynthetic reaction center cytochrome c subunit